MNPELKMKIVSTTLTGNSEALIADALRSVLDLVDVCVVIDTGVTDRTLEVAADIAQSKLIVEAFPWVHSFSAARNFALDCARKHQGDWAVTVDTDERLSVQPEGLRALLQTTSEDILLMFHEDRHYSKERVFRLPARGQFVGPTHEYFSIPGREIIADATFAEVCKSEADLQHKFIRDFDILQAWTTDHPDDPRWHYYLGETLKNLQRYEDAIVAYARCTALDGWDEESAWACFQAAYCHEMLEQYEAIVNLAAVGMTRHPGIAELPWYAAYASLKLGQARRAVHWAQLAITWGLYEGDGHRVHRIAFRHMPALFEGPYDVLRYAYRTLHEVEAANKAEAKYQAAKTARTVFENAR